MSKDYSIILQTKIPAFIRDDPAYSKFVSFFEEYYTWFNDTYNITGFDRQLDIDTADTVFLEYFKADFLPNFPDEIETDVVKLVKIAKELYQAKGIPDSFKFLFRALYNTSVEVFPTREQVFKASDGKWVVPRSIKIKSYDSNFLHIANFRVYGERSHAVGVIESSKRTGQFTQIYFSDIQRTFFSGENVRIIDASGKDVYFLNGVYSSYTTTPNVGSVQLASQIIGALSSITADSVFRGTQYNIGDPVAIIGGIDEYTSNTVKAVAEVSNVTTGAILDVLVTNGGHGYTLYPNTTVDVISNGVADANSVLFVSLLDTSNPATIANLSLDVISTQNTVTIGANNYNFLLSANANTTLANALSFLEFTTYPIQQITVDTSGSYQVTPTLDVNSFVNNASGNTFNLEQFGILAPIEIVNPGMSYANNETLNIIGGDGYSAYAKITSVNTSGSIVSVDYYSGALKSTTGGFGYTNANLPTITINTANGTGAVLSVPGVMGTGVEYTLTVDTIGSITGITLTNPGESYSSTPNVSLRVQDIIVSNVFNSLDSTVVYQGTSPNTATYLAYVESMLYLSSNNTTNPADDLYRLRVYDYKGTITANTVVKVNDLVTDEALPELKFEYTYNTNGFTSGVKTYGDGKALGTATFLNGVITDNGRFLNTDGFASEKSYIQSEIYNNYTYFLETEKDYATYKDVLQNMVHPIGARVISKNLLKSNASSIITTANTFVLSGGNTYLDHAAILVESSGNYTNAISILPNTFTFDVNSTIRVVSDNNMGIYSTIVRVDGGNNILYLSDSYRYYYPNVYRGYVDVNSNSVVVTVNNYRPVEFTVNNFVQVGDMVYIGNNIQTVINTVNNTIYLSGSLYNSGNSFISIKRNLLSNNIHLWLSNTIYNPLYVYDSGGSIISDSANVYLSSL